MRKRTLVILFLVLGLALPLLASDPDRAEKAALQQRLLAEASARTDKGAGGVGTLTFDKSKIEIFSWSWGLSQSATPASGGGGAGKATFSDFSFTKAVGTASYDLFKACATGQHIKDVTFEIHDGKGTPVARLVFSDVLVSSYQTGGSGELPLESITLTYAKVDYFILIGL